MYFVYVMRNIFEAKKLTHKEAWRIFGSALSHSSLFLRPAQLFGRAGIFIDKLNQREIQVAFIHD